MLDLKIIEVQVYRGSSVCVRRSNKVLIYRILTFTATCFYSLLLPLTSERCVACYPNCHYCSKTLQENQKYTRQQKSCRLACLFMNPEIHKLVKLKKETNHASRWKCGVRGGGTGRWGSLGSAVPASKRCSESNVQVVLTMLLNSGQLALPPLLPETKTQS